MALSVTHTYVSAIPDDGDITVVQPSDWNAEHTITLSQAALVGRSSAGAATEITIGSGLSLSGTTLSSTDVGGTVTSVSTALNTTGTDLAISVATATTTPAITLSVPTASASNRGALSAADWTTFNNKGSGTVTSVSGTAPVVSSGGATPAISMAAATTAVNGYLTAVDWTTFNNKGAGSVTSVAALTLGTTGTDLGSSVANGTTTPVITLNVPSASAANRGALLAADWSTFNAKQSAITFGTGVQTALGVNIGSAGAPVLFNGAGGTPTSLTLTNALGLPVGGITQNTARLLGRTTASAGVTEEISIGTGLSLAAGVLSSTDVGGTVTSVSFTGGLISVATATSTPALTVAGTSGGIPYFSGATTWATSAALAANALVVGGGAGAAPATVTTGANVLTALGVAVGSAGAFVVNGGALGTPSSGTLTNCTFPTLNQNTTGSAAKWTTARDLAGNSVDGSANVAFANKFIVQGTADAGLSAAQFLGALGTGIVKNTTTTGVLSIAVAGDFPTLNQSTTGSAATLTTTRAIYGNNFDGSAALTQVIASTYGGTGNGFAKLSGPATTEKTFTLPNASATILTDAAAVTVAQGGTGVATLGANGVVVGNATGAVHVTAAGTSGHVLTSNGAGVNPTFQAVSAVGYVPNGTQTGATAQAHGLNSIANGAEATAAGDSANATGAAATAVGSDSVANGASASAAGEGAIANGDNATAYGAASNATGATATAVGQSSLASSTLTAAFGQAANAASANSTSIGASSKANAADATALGKGAVASAANATAIGTGSTSATANLITLGTASETVSLIGGRLQFPATQITSADANCLDDYEEGTWTPTMSFSGDSTGITYSVQTGTYTKIGNRVLVDAVIVLSNNGSAAGDGRVGGFPFTIGARFSLAIMNNNTQGLDRDGYIDGDAANTYVSVVYRNDSAITEANISDSFYCVFTGQYRI